MVEDLFDFEDLEDFIKKHQATRGMSIDGLSTFVELGLNTRVNLEPDAMKGLSIKISEDQNMILESVANALGKSKSKILQEIISSYIESAYLSYLKGLYQIGELDQENTDIDAVQEHLIKIKNKLKDSKNEYFHIFMLAKMGFMDRALDLADETLNQQKKEQDNE